MYWSGALLVGKTDGTTPTHPLDSDFEIRLAVPGSLLVNRVEQNHASYFQTFFAAARVWLS